MGTLVLLFLDGSSLFLQVSRKTIKALMNLIFHYTYAVALESSKM